jgi:hypothetical protein
MVCASAVQELACKFGSRTAAACSGRWSCWAKASRRRVKHLLTACNKSGIGRGCVEAGIAYERGEVGKEDIFRAQLLYAMGCRARKPDQRGCDYAKKLASVKQ